MDGNGGRIGQDPPRRRALASVVAAAALALAGCTGAGSPSASTAPSSAPSQAPSVGPSATSTQTPRPSVGPTATPGLETKSAVDIVFEEQQLNARGVLDVLWPADPGPWPVAVMLHGNPGPINKSYLSTHAWLVARTGYVVFVPNWGMSGGAAYDALAPHVQAEADARQVACAIAFVAQEAPKYGGDPSWITILGHSAGANMATVVGFTTPAPSAGCFAPTRRDADAVIAWEGNWLLMDPPSVWDPVYEADPAVFEALTPWTHIAERPDLPVVILESSFPGLGREATDALGPDGWLTARDPTGEFTAAFEAMGAFADDWIYLEETQRVLADRLDEAGNLVSYDVMPDSTHDRVSPQGFVVMVDAFNRLLALGD